MLKQAICFSSMIALRFFALFIVLPVLSLYVNTLGGSAMLLGFALGGYAITQMIVQVPFGLASDKYGRKKIIFIGIIIFIVSSLVCAFSEDLIWLIIGRFMQGFGTSIGVLNASISDVVKEEHKTKAMAMTGMMISLSFTLSIIASSLLFPIIHIKGLFLISAFCGLLELILLFFSPKETKADYEYPMAKDFRIKNIIQNKEFMILNITNMLEKALLSISFLFIPLIWVNNLGQNRAELYQIYLPSAIIGFFAIGLCASIAEKRGKFKFFMCLGILLMGISYLMITFNSKNIFIIGVILFFVGFSYLEPIMQSFISKISLAHQRGLNFGMIGSFGFFGSFIGGMIGGILYKNASLEYVSSFVLVLCILWVIGVYQLKEPQKSLLSYLPIGEYAIKSGIYEYYINKKEQIMIFRHTKNVSMQDILNSKQGK